MGQVFRWSNWPSPKGEKDIRPDHHRELISSSRSVDMNNSKHDVQLDHSGKVTWLS